MKRVTGIDPTGSTLDRTAMCAASAALPQIFDGDDSDDKARSKGSARHEFLKRTSDVGREAALAEVDPKHREHCEVINTAKLADRLKLSTEIALAYNWVDDTARILTPVAPRVYEIDTECEVAATADIAAHDPGASRVYVGDYKGPRAWLPKPENSMQLGVEAVALARIYGADEAQLEYIRLLDDGNSRRFDGVLDTFGIEAAAARVRETMGLVGIVRREYEAGRIPNVTEGPWCGYCPARMHCPAKTAGMRAVLAGDAKISLRESITPENASRVYEMWRKAEDYLSQVKSAIYAYGIVAPIKVRDEEDGSIRYFGEISREGNDVLDGKKTHQVVTKRYGAEAANEVVTMEATKKAIGEAVKKYKPADATQKSEIEAIIDDIDSLGGIKNSVITKPTEYTISPKGEAKARKRSAA